MRIEEVKKITHPGCDIAYSEKVCPKPGSKYCKECEDEATQIIKLFEPQIGAMIKKFFQSILAGIVIGLMRLIAWLSKLFSKEE